MFIQRTRPDTGAAETEYHWTSFTRRCAEELGLQSRHADGAFGPDLTGALGREATDGTGQIAHHPGTRPLFQGDDAVALDTYRRAKLFGKEGP
jgi:hypothetical protein